MINYNVGNKFKAIKDINIEMVIDGESKIVYTVKIDEVLELKEILKTSELGNTKLFVFSNSKLDEKAVVFAETEDKIKEDLELI